jgi:RNA polymerase sigma-70 factor (ECF subfamily)
MADDAPVPGWSVGRFRGYLQLLARLQLDERLRGELDPSDVVQEALLKAHQGQAECRAQTDAERAAWLRQVLANTLADAARRYLGADMRNVDLERSLQESSARLERLLADDRSTPEEQAQRHEQLARLAEGLAALPDDQRQAVELRHLQGIPVGEVARRMGRTRPAVAGLLRRGLDALRQRLAEKDP